MTLLAVAAQVQRVLRVSRVVADLQRAAAFYCEALDFRRIAHGPCDRHTCAALGIDAAEEVVLRLGDQEIALVQFAEAGRPYPPDSQADDLWFQHLAVVVSDADAACRRLAAVAGWQPISRDGPQRLPPADGGVTAFKFRDPDGHPLELLAFPPDSGRAVWQQRRSQALFLGIDHTALSVGCVARSEAFYVSLGLRVAGRSLNVGPAQARLDGLDDVRLQVVGLRPPSADGPGLELLAYRPPGRPASQHAVRDLGTDWTTLQAAGPSRAVRDPDGHLLLLRDQSGLPA